MGGSSSNNNNNNVNSSAINANSNQGSSSQELEDEYNFDVAAFLAAVCIETNANGIKIDNVFNP